MVHRSMKMNSRQAVTAGLGARRKKQVEGGVSNDTQTNFLLSDLIWKPKGQANEGLSSDQTRPTTKNDAHKPLRSNLKFS